VIKILLARRYVTGQIVADAHLDDTMFLDDAETPDPAWVVHHEWYINPEDWASRTQTEKNRWIADMRQEFEAICKEQLAIVSDREAGGTVLPIEGATFPP
jgi:hypothetical protein